jgi:hypothetical protein
MENINEVHKFMALVNKHQPIISNLRFVRKYMEDNNLDPNITLNEDDEIELYRILGNDIFRTYKKLVDWSTNQKYMEQLYDDFRNYPLLHEIFTEYTDGWGLPGGIKGMTLEPLQKYKIFTSDLQKIFNILAKYPPLTELPPKTPSPSPKKALPKKASPKKALPKKASPPNLKDFPLDKLPLGVLQNMIDIGALSAEDIAYLKESNKDVKAYLQQGETGQYAKSLIKNAKTTKLIYPKGEKILLDFGLTAGGETGFDALLIFGGPLANYDENNNYIDTYFIDLPEETQKDLLDTILFGPNHVEVEMFRPDPNIPDDGFVYIPINSSSGDSITVGDFLNAWFENNRYLANIDFEAGHGYFEGFYKSDKGGNKLTISYGS